MDHHERPILVIGGGISGMTAAIEAAEVGHPVVLVEARPWLGGRVLQMHRYFPKMCPPGCGFEINVRRLRASPLITVHTRATVEAITGDPDNLKARIRIRPSYVSAEHLLNEQAVATLPFRRPDDFNHGVGTTSALHRPPGSPWPPGHVLDRDALTGAEAEDLAYRLPIGAVDLEATEEEIEIKVASVILATGWRPYDATRLVHLGFGALSDVLTNVMMERLAAPSGPTKGRIVRPSDGEPPARVAFVQCAGSRDVNHLPYCSAVCCMASLKQVRLVREQLPDAEVTVFYIDIRTVGRHDAFYRELLDDDHVRFVRGKVGRVTASSEPGRIAVDVEDTVARTVLHEPFDLVVLATGMVPNTLEIPTPFTWRIDDDGFVAGGGPADRLHVAGCVKRPCDVARTTRDATGAALGAIRDRLQGD